MSDVIGQLRTLVRDLALTEEAGDRIKSLFVAPANVLLTTTLAPTSTTEPSGEPGPA